MCFVQTQPHIKDLIYKQTLIPLSEFGETIIFKNRFYGVSTNFTKYEEELAENNPENYKKGKNIRSRGIRYNY